jgi:hypothetical protein
MTPPKASSRSKRVQPKRRLDLIKHRRSHRKVVEFPQVQGRIVDKIEFSTDFGYHSITIDFKDQTSLSFVIDPSFLLEGRFLDISSGDERVRKRWPPVQSVTNK